MPDGHHSGEGRHLSRESLGAQVASSIRRDIVRGVIPPGTVLAQEQLCAEYDVSRIPIRDALLTLVTEGFVKRTRRNQVVTAEFTVDDVMDTFEIEGSLCAIAARRATGLATAEDLDRIDELLRRGEALGDPPERTTAAEVGWQFHQSVNRLAQSRRLVAALRAVSVTFLMDFMQEVPDYWRIAREQHRGIYEAIRDGDADRAEALTRQHFLDKGSYVANYLRAEEASRAAGDGRPSAAS